MVERAWRKLNQAYAFVFGYFWLPCPLCGEHFGGHEWRYGEAVILSKGEGCCTKCIPQADELNAEYRKKHFLATVQATRAALSEEDKP